MHDLEPVTPRTVVRFDAELLVDVIWLADSGLSLAAAAQRLGYRTPGALERALGRAGRRDLIARMQSSRRTAL